MKARAGIGISIVIAFFTALTIASSPRLHERLHKVGSQREAAAVARGINFLPLKQSRRLLAPASLLHRNPPEARCFHQISIMKTFNETNSSNHNRDAERGEHGDGAGRGGVTQPFTITGCV